MLDMHNRPSDIMGINDEYLAFCFDEACAYIIKELKDGNKPILKVDNGEKKYTKPSDLYKKYDN